MCQLIFGFQKVFVLYIFEMYNNYLKLSKNKQTLQYKNKVINIKFYYFNIAYEIIV